MSNDFDVIVIGSGIGGLSCASFLTMMGKRVLILEQSEAPGGTIQTVRKEGYDWEWNLGLQYLAMLSTQVGPIYLKETDILPLITNPPVQFKPLGPKPEDSDELTRHTYQKLDLPQFGEDCRYNLVADKDGMKRYLQREFPNNSSQIEDYWSQVIKVIDENLASFMTLKILPPALADFLFPIIMEKLKPLTDANCDSALDKFFPGDSLETQKLKTILYSYWNFLGLPLNTNLSLWAIGQNQQMNGIYVPVGGSKALVQGMINYITKPLPGNPTKPCGEIRTGSQGEVERIKVEGLFCKKATGVVMKNGEQITADYVVSSAGVPQTLGKMVDPDLVSRRVRKGAEEHISIPAIAILRVGFKKHVNHSVLAQHVERVAYRTMYDKAWNMDDNPTSPNWRPDEVMILFPKLYATEPDDTETLQTAEIIILTDYKKHWSKVSFDDKEFYDRVEGTMTSILKDFFVKKFPALEELIDPDSLWMTTPRSLYLKTRHQGSSIYGLDSYKLLDNNLQPRSGIRNLYFTGEDIFAHGITTSCGMATALVILINELKNTAWKFSRGILFKLPRLIVDMLLPTNPMHKLPPNVKRDF